MSEVIKLPMVCVCDGDGQREAEDLRTKARAQFSPYVTEQNPDEHFVTNIIATLWVNYNVTIESIHCDMWFGVRAVRDDEMIRVECDYAEDGLAAILCYVVDTYPKGEDGW